MSKIHLTKEQIDIAIHLYRDEGWTLTAVGKKFGLPYPSMRKILIKNGVKPRRGWAKTTRQCRMCGIVQPINNFSYKSYICKTCAPEWHREKGYVFKKFGIGREEYDALFEKQKGCCAICGKHESELERHLAVDHDHSNGRIRGLLCTNCNFMLGAIHDDVEFLRRAIEYLGSYNNLSKPQQSAP